MTAKIPREKCFRCHRDLSPSGVILKAKRPLFALLPAFFTLLVPGAELRVEFREKITTTRPGHPPARAENTLVVVRFGRGVFYTIRNPNVKFYDIERDVIIETTAGLKVSEYPMLAVLAERTEGLIGSLDTYRTMSRAGVLKENDRYAIFHLETRYALQSDIRSSVQPRKDRSGESTTFSIDGKHVASWTDSAYKLGDGEMALFKKFLIYEARLHPAIRKAMLRHRCLPKQMSFRYPTTTGLKEVQWSIIDAGMESETAYTKVLRDALPAQADEITRLVIEELPHIGERALRAADFDKMFAKSIDLRYYLDAMLVSVEFYLMSGQQTVQALQAIKPFIEQDPQLIAYLNGLDVSSRSAAKASMVRLAGINRTNIFRQHILDVALADTFKETMKYRAAEELYIKALQQNPYMTGVWVSLGDLYYRTKRMEKAWNCWNAAFAMERDHPALDPIKERNQLLSKSFPEYF